MLLGQGRLYHHTPPISLIYARREAMRIAMRAYKFAGAPSRVQQALVAGCEANG